MIRAVVDLNVIISGIIVPRGFAFYVWSAWLASQFTLVISEGMLQLARYGDVGIVEPLNFLRVLPHPGSGSPS
jgi:predicted nucleic acid-binding protein